MLNGARRFVALNDEQLEAGRLRMEQHRAVNLANERRRAEEVMLRVQEQTAARTAARKKAVAAQAAAENARDAKRRRLTGHG